MLELVEGSSVQLGAEGQSGQCPELLWWGWWDAPLSCVVRGSLMDTGMKPITSYGIQWTWESSLDNLKTSQLSSAPFRRTIDKCAMGLGLRTNKRQMLG